MRGRKRIICPYCGGEIKDNHKDGSPANCPVPAAVTERLVRWKAENKTAWRAKLCRAWTNREDESDALLRQARNLIGPTNLYRIKL